MLPPFLPIGGGRKTQPPFQRGGTKKAAAAEAQVDAKLKASKGEAEAIASAIQEVNAQAATQQVEDPPTPSKKSKSKKEIRDGPRLPKCPTAGLSKEDAEWAHRSLRWARAKGPPTPAVRPRKSIGRRAAALLPGCGRKSELPNVRGSATEA